MKRIESPIKIAGMKFEFSNLEIRFHKRQVSFLIGKTVKYIRCIKYGRWFSIFIIYGFCDKLLITM